MLNKTRGLATSKKKKKNENTKPVEVIKLEPQRNVSLDLLATCLDKYFLLLCVVDVI